MGHSFEIFKYLIKEKMAGQKHLRENLTFLNYRVSSWLNFRFSQIPRIALNSLFISLPPPWKHHKTKGLLRKSRPLSHHHKNVILSNVNKRWFFIQPFGIESLNVNNVNILQIRGKVFLTSLKKKYKAVSNWQVQYVFAFNPIAGRQTDLVRKWRRSPK